MSDEESSGVFSRRKDYERRVPVATLPLPFFYSSPISITDFVLRRLFRAFR